MGNILGWEKNWNKREKIIREPTLYEKKLILIFRKSLDFLNATDSLKLLCLNNTIRCNLPNNDYYLYVSKLIVSWIANFDKNDPKMLENFAKFLECKQFASYRDLFNCVKSSENLIKNPCGDMKFQNWVKLDRGDGWAIENWPAYKHKDTVFVSSYSWCSLSQAIDIPLSSHKRFIIAGAYVSRRGDCGAIAKVDVEIYDKNHEIVKTYTTGDFTIQEPGINYALKIKFEIKSHYRAAKIIYSGKDSKFWAGWYGARFAYCYAWMFNYS